MNQNKQILQDLITLSGLNQKQYAEKQGINEKVLSHWVTGYRNISLKTLTEMAKKEGYSLTINFQITKL